MTNEHHHISSLVTDLVEMAQATKRLPELERELREAYQVIDQLTSRRAELERKIEQEVAINTDLAAKLHAAEVARNDAGFRQLEAENQIGHLQTMLTNMFHGVGTTLATLSGDAKDKSVRMAATEREEFEEYRAAKNRAAAQQAEEVAKPVDPTPAIPDIATSADTSTESGSGDGNTSGEGEGERAPDPTGESWVDTPSLLARPLEPSSTTACGGVSVSPDPTVSPPTSPSETVPGTTASPLVGVQTHPVGKYTGKRYADWSYFVSEESWCANGGTHESYWEGRYILSPKTA